MLTIVVSHHNSIYMHNAKYDIFEIVRDKSEEVLHTITYHRSLETANKYTPVKIAHSIMFDSVMPIAFRTQKTNIFAMLHGSGTGGPTIE